MNKIHSKKSALWDSSTDISESFAFMPKELEHEVVSYFSSMDMNGDLQWDGVKPGELPLLQRFAMDIRHLVDNEMRFVIVKSRRKSEKKIHRLITWALSNCLGEPLIQDDKGSKLIEVYDRRKNGGISQGARYHQTRQGGSAHTDNVNIIEFWDYLVFSCHQPGLVGGETVLVSALTLHKELKRYPEILTILEGEFWWERRGLSDEIFRAPILTYSHTGEPLFRYLRSYLEAAHQKAESPLTGNQVWALDFLDCLLEQGLLQLRYKLEKGDILVSKDSQVLHARTSFMDYYPFNQNGIEENKRFFDRLWVKKNNQK